MGRKPEKLNRRDVLKQSAAVAAAWSRAGYRRGMSCPTRQSHSGGGKRVIVVGIDGMDPRLAQA